MVPKFSANNITVALQGFDLKKHFPEAYVDARRNSLTWRANILPSPLSDTYTVQLKYSLEDRPRVYVLKPELKAPEGKSVPHVYPGNRLCLYLPRSGEWNGTMLLSQAIIPWISEWLLHYEIWYATGKWCGGGVHLKLKDKKD